MIRTSSACQLPSSQNPSLSSNTYLVGLSDKMSSVGVNEYKKRVATITKNLESKGIDIALIPTGTNFQYLAGYSYNSMERLSLLILREGGYSLFVPGLMEDQVRENSWIKDIVVWRDHEDQYQVLRNYLGTTLNNIIGIEGSLSFSHLAGIFQSKIPSDLSSIDNVFSMIRSVKSEAEIGLIGEAIRRSERSLLKILPELEEGITEAEIARILEWNFIDEGLAKPSFGSIVAFGENGALPHHEPGSRKLKKGDSVVIDFGGSYGEYCSDTTRTFFFGMPDAEFVKAYGTVKRAQENAMTIVTETAKYSDLDAAARSELRNAGYGEMNIRLGHGVGLDVHESPFLVPSNSGTVQDGAVFTVEPGIYRPGRFGIRLEDTTYVKNGKCVSFNSLIKEYDLKKM